MNVLQFIFGASGQIGSIDRVSFWTFAIAFIAWIGFQQSNKISSTKFIIDFKNAFFNPKTREIVKIFYDNNLVKYDKKKEKFINNGEELSPFDVDDGLLGHFDDLGTFEKLGVVDISMIYELFDTYIEAMRRNNAIKDYIIGEREDPENIDIYDNFDYIYCKCKSYGEAKRSHNRKFLWKIKWFYLYRKIIKKSLKELDS